MQRILAIFVVTLSIAVPAHGAKIAVIGTGNVGSALGVEFAAEGHTIVYGSRDPSKQSVVKLVARTGHGASATTQVEAARDASIVILAVPGLLAAEITGLLGDLSGKIIIDPTNPLVFTDTGVEHGVATSNAEIIQAAAPGARVVKAFNVLSWQFMMEPESAGGPITVPLVGNDSDAKAVVADLVRSLDLQPFDVGSLKYARWVEGMAILLINNNFGPLPNFNLHLREYQ